MGKTIKIASITIFSLLAACVLLLLVLNLALPKLVPPNVKYVEITLPESGEFTRAELTDAAQTVKDNFKLYGCVLLDIWYDEEFSDVYKGYYDCDSENMIVLLSNFYTLPAGADQSLNEDFVYRNWHWILMRESRNSPWIVKDYGY